jgi:type VI secretion system Hcp family effector
MAASSTSKTFYMIVEGAKQGKFHGSKPGPRMNGMEVHSYSFGVSTPHDPSSGSMAGRRQHKPITITKEVDAASPLFFRALASNEALSVIVGEIDEYTGIAKEVIHLKDVVIVAIRPTGQFMQHSLGQKQWQDIVLAPSAAKPPVR